MIPLLHDFEGESVLVLGGGSVGARKARRFAAEAETVVVAPSFADADFGDAALVRAAPAPEAVAGWVDRVDPALVVAATDNAAVNDAVGRAGADAGILVNRADRSGGREAGSVVVPATVEDDPVTVAVSTGGRAPALSRHLRERIEDEVEGAGAMAELVGDLRSELKAESAPPSERRNAVRAVVRAPSVWKALQGAANNPREEADDVIRQQRGDRG